MKSKKLTVIWLLVVALLLASMYAFSFLAEQAGYENLLLVTPNTFGSQGLDTEKLEEIVEDDFLLTYSIRQQTSIQAVNSRHTAMLAGTNHCFADVMGYVFLKGGFFSKTAQDSKQKHAVLNETAAFSIFGSSNIAGSPLKLNGETWVVTGVIQDNDEESLNIYVPASITGGHADSIIVLTDKTATEAYVKNKLKDIGVRETNYDFINLSKSAGAFRERFSVAWKALLSVAFLLFILMSGGRLADNFRFYKDKMRELYFSELVTYYRNDFFKTLAGLVLFAAGIIAVLALSLQILETCLAWQELVPITGELISGAFGHKLGWLEKYQIWDEILFGFCVLLIVSGLISALFMGRKKQIPLPYVQAGHIIGYRI